MIKILTATNNPNLNEELKKEKGVEIVCKDIQYKEGILEILESMSFFIKVIYDIQYNNNIEKYKDEIYGIARGEFDE